MSDNDESQKNSVTKPGKTSGTKFFDQGRVLDDAEAEKEEEVRNKWQELENKRSWDRKPLKIANRSNPIDKNTRDMVLNLMQMVEIVRDLPNSMNPLAARTKAR